MLWLPQKYLNKRAPFFRFVTIFDILVFKLGAILAYVSLLNTTETAMIVSLLLTLFVVELCVLCYSVIRRTVAGKLCKAFAQCRKIAVIAFSVWIGVAGLTLILWQKDSWRFVLFCLLPLILFQLLVNLELSEGLLIVTHKVSSDELDESESML